MGVHKGYRRCWGHRDEGQGGSRCGEAKKQKRKGGGRRCGEAGAGSEEESESEDWNMEGVGRNG
eukprot:781973-Pleurochrysis_carterae.AAC.1